ncbi:hypothetical protein RRG08_062599 [Elysia crispata]|uniref:Uncharacterized protein n=1 Tax=Elysia crispata TaxID=231223 RepID=A0AAE1D6T5_9GAST|nr:hypothetical protein RRG08_062599 [Elysia crispata]
MLLTGVVVVMMMGESGLGRHLGDSLTHGHSATRPDLEKESLSCAKIVGVVSLPTLPTAAKVYNSQVTSGRQAVTTGTAASRALHQRHSRGFLSLHEHEHTDRH